MESGTGLVRFGAVSAAVLFGLGAAPARAALDQSFLDPGISSTATAVHSTADLAQTFTVGFEGTLSQVDLLLESSTRTPTAPLIVEIRETVLGIPVEAVLGSVTASVVPMGQDQTFVSFDFLSQGIVVTPGEEIAIVLRSSQVSAAGFFGWVYDSVPVGYAGGEALRRSPVTNPWASVPVGHTDPADFGFRTYVVPVPEPASGALVACGLAALAARRRRHA